MCACVLSVHIMILDRKNDMIIPINDISENMLSQNRCRSDSVVVFSYCQFWNHPSQVQFVFVSVTLYPGTPCQNRRR